MPDRERDHLHPGFLSRCLLLEQLMAHLGHPILMTEGWRSGKRQEELWRNRKPGAVVAPPGHSAHEVCQGEAPAAMAADWCFADGGGITYDGPWRLLGAVAEQACGMEWGGGWETQTDRPHTQEPEWQKAARSMGWTKFEG
jgi:hypothetical protein